MKRHKFFLHDQLRFPIFSKVPGAFWGWEVKILVGNLAECRTTLISVQLNQ